MKNIFKAIIGIILIFIRHIPRLFYLLLLASYGEVFHAQYRTLTANPAEHIKRAKRMLRKKDNSLILYIAVELRFTIERMVFWQILFANGASNRMIDEKDPVKKRKNISRLDKNADYPHEIIFTNQETKETMKWADYTPIDAAKLEHIKGMLGDILHAKEGLSLGIPDDPYYSKTTKFLRESIDYLESILKTYNNYFSMKDLKQFTFIKK